MASEALIRENMRIQRKYATAKFNERMAEIRGYLSQLQALADNRLNFEADTIDWSCVATAAHIAEELKEVVRFAVNNAKSA